MRQESCKMNAYTMRYIKSTEIVHNANHRSYKHHNYFLCIRNKRDFKLNALQTNRTT